VAGQTARNTSFIQSWTGTAGFRKTLAADARRLIFTLTTTRIGVQRQGGMRVSPADFTTAQLYRKSRLMLLPIVSIDGLRLVDQDGQNPAGTLFQLLGSWECQ
jgi:hypothetical protein